MCSPVVDGGAAAAECTRRHVAMFDNVCMLVRHGISEVIKGATDIHTTYYMFDAFFCSFSAIWQPISANNYSLLHECYYCLWNIVKHLLHVSVLETELSYRVQIKCFFHMSGFESFVKISNFRETNISIYLAETCQQQQWQVTQ